MPTKFQFQTVTRLIAEGVTNYIQIRQQAGLTAEELDDILKHMDYYANYFAEQERKETLDRLNRINQKKPWWKK